MVTKDEEPHGLLQSDAIQRAIEYGVDITLLKENLKRSPTERIENLQRWLAFAAEVQRAGALKRRQDATRREGTLR